MLAASCYHSNSIWHRQKRLRLFTNGWFSWGICWGIQVLTFSTSWTSEPGLMVLCNRWTRPYCWPRSARLPPPRRKSGPIRYLSYLVPIVEGYFSDHGADSIQIGVESNGLPLHSLRVGVVHWVLEGSLTVVVFVDGAAGVLCFWCRSAF